MVNKWLHCLNRPAMRKVSWWSGSKGEEGIEIVTGEQGPSGHREERRAGQGDLLGSFLAPLEPVSLSNVPVVEV